MKSWLKHPMRVTGRLLWLTGEFFFGLLLYLASRVLGPRGTPRQARAWWLHRTCRRALRIFSARIEVAGSAPLSGLLVCNHLSYMDILVISACAPSVFVAKREVKTWPVFGWYARLAGTVFVDRERRTHVARAARELGAALCEGALVVLFPEGTSSDGSTVLPFKPSLLQPVAKDSHPVTAARIGYRLTDGDVAEEVCYWKDMTLVPHLINLMSKKSLQVTLRFQPSQAGRRDRKELARQLHSEIVNLGRTAPA